MHGYPPPGSLVVQATMFFYVISSPLAALFLVLLWRNLHRICLVQAVDNLGANLLINFGTDAGPSLRDVVAAIYHGNLRIRLHESMDPDLYITHDTHKLADTTHPQSPFLRDWAEVADATISSTREVIRYFNGSGNTKFYPLVQSVVLSTLLHLFFQLPVTPTNIEDIIWIVDDVRRTSHLCRLVKSSPNPRGVLVPQAAIQRLVLAATCMVEYKGKNISLLQQAGLLLRHPTYLNPDVARLVGKAKKSEPPIQSIYGKLPVGSIPFFIPLDLLPSSACILAADGSCASWLHKAGFPGQTECGGSEWLIHATMIILSAIQTEVRKANLIVDWDVRDPEAWEDWDIRRLRVGR